MSDWLITYGSWLLAPFGLIGLWIAGRKNRWGWVFGMTTQALWAFYLTGTHQYGLLLGTAGYFIVYLRNWLRWRREDQEADPLTRVIALLHELNKLELEKDRDGSAEQPWWYMRDGEEGFAGVLGITFTDELPEEDEDDA